MYAYFCTCHGETGELACMQVHHPSTVALVHGYEKPRVTRSHLGWLCIPVRHLTACFRQGEGSVTARPAY